MLALLALAPLAVATGLQQTAAPVGEPAANQTPWWTIESSAQCRPVVLEPHIVPERWWILRSSGSDARVFGRYLLDPQSAAPTAAAAAGDPSWEPRAASAPEGARWAYACVESDREQVRMADLQGATRLFVNGECFVGDPERRGFRGVPVALRRGTNDVFVQGAAGPFELELWTPATHAVLGTWDLELPFDSPENEMAFEMISYAAFNAGTTAGWLHVHYGHAVRADGPHQPVVSDWTCGRWLPPLGVHMAESFFADSFTDRSAGVHPGREAIVPLVLYFPGDPCAEGQLVRRRVPAPERLPRFPGRNADAVAGGLLARVLRPRSIRSVGWMIVGTRGAQCEALLSRARFDQQSLWYRTRFTPWTRSDELYLDESRRSAEREQATRQPTPGAVVLLYGNEDTNAAWSRLVGQDCPIRVGNGFVRGPGLDLEGDGITGWFLHPRADPSRGKVLVVCDTGARGARLGAFMDVMALAAVEGDFAFFDADGPETGEPRLLDRGWFDGKGGVVR